MVRASQSVTQRIFLSLAAKDKYKMSNSTDANETRLNNTHQFGLVVCDEERKARLVILSLCISDLL